MKIIDICKYNGRNIFSHKPVVRMTVDIGELAEVSTNQIVNFNQRLLERFPGLKTHYCSLGYEGGFVDRLEEGTLVSHVTEHLALELQCIIGYDVYFGKTRIAQEPSVYCIVYEYINGYCAEKFGQAAVEIISGLACKKAVPIRRIIRELREYATEYDLGPSTQAIWNEARRRNIPVTRLGDGSLLQLGYGKYIRYLEASLPDTASSISVDLAKNKQLSKDLLKKHNLPVPEGGVVHSEDEAVLLAHDLGYPIAIKPLDGNQGKGVTTNIDNEISLRKAYNVASDYSDRIMVEKCISGKDYRILVVGDQVAAAAERRPPLVIGDGIRSIAELVEKENRNPNRGDGHEKPLTKINIDEVSKELLSRSNLTEQSVPGKGEVIYLRENGNLSTGGSARDCTAEIHPVNKNIAIRAAKAIGLEIAGIDVVAKDISQPLTLSNGAIIEINAAPGLRMHLYPTEGQATNVAANILDYMYPPGTPCSIPIVSVTGTNGKTTVTRIIYHVLSLTGQKVGMTCSSGTYIGSECISRGDNTGPVSAQSILSNKEVEVAVLETARGGIIKRGLGYDLADVGIVTNVSEDHLGLNGINSVEDMAFVKALVVEAVKPDGYAILNADDNMAGYMARGVRCNLIYFSRRYDNLLVKNHINKGGTAVVVENDLVTLYRGNTKKPILSIHEIPITCGGKITCNIENSLAAVACLYALGIPEYVIWLGLMSFRPEPIFNEGRFNLFDMGSFQVMLDYGHNISGYRSVAEYVKSTDANRLVGIIGMPGDRLDNAIYDVGKISGQVFDKIYIKEDTNLRGREPGEVANLLYQGAIAGGAPKESIKVMYSEIEALEKAIKTALPGDLIVMFYEQFEPAEKLVQKFKTEAFRPALLFSEGKPNENNTMEHPVQLVQ